MGGILDQRPGVFNKGTDPSEVDDEIYNLSDLEEDGTCATGRRQKPARNPKCPPGTPPPEGDSVDGDDFDDDVGFGHVVSSSAKSPPGGAGVSRGVVQRWALTSKNRAENKEKCVISWDVYRS